MNNAFAITIVSSAEFSGESIAIAITKEERP
jgi:hypothetical protein